MKTSVFAIGVRSRSVSKAKRYFHANREAVACQNRGIDWKKIPKSAKFVTRLLCGRSESKTESA
jgi:hypothetical protein